MKFAPFMQVFTQSALVVHVGICAGAGVAACAEACEIATKKSKAAEDR
jgi:hypothetical protein